MHTKGGADASVNRSTVFKSVRSSRRYFQDVLNGPFDISLTYSSLCILTLPHSDNAVVIWWETAFTFESI